MENKKLITLPFFHGFYESLHSELIDNELYPDDEESEQEPIELTTEQCSKLHNGYCKEYVETIVYYDGVLSSDNMMLPSDISGGLLSSLKFHELESPKYYNYTTDVIFCTISNDDIRRLYRLVDKDILQQHLKDTFTSYDGFISYYSNDLNDWLVEKPFTEWDHNQYGAILAAFFIRLGIDEHNISNRMIEDNIRETISNLI